jgi:hypothetical protein
MLAARPKRRHEGGRYYVGGSLTALDVYSATFTGMFGPLPQERCKTEAATRAAFKTMDSQTEAALNPILFEQPGYDVSRALVAAALSLSTRSQGQLEAGPRAGKRHVGDAHDPIGTAWVARGAPPS